MLLLQGIRGLVIALRIVLRHIPPWDAREIKTIHFI